ncbi:MAG: glycoside hydrolase family 44 protein [Candidatus Sulfotelmatobacter sp.]
MAAAFGSSPHFYDMDNEIDIWGSTHRDVHPNPSGYEELRDTYREEALALKGWDPQGRPLWAGELLLVVLLEWRKQQR